MRQKEIRVRLNPILNKLKRGHFGGPQVIIPKDFGIIIGYSGLGKNSKIVEAGGGAGFLTISLANVCKKVYTYEIKKDYYKTIKQNLETCGIKNVNVKNKDVKLGIKEKDVDAVILDMPNSDEVIPIAFNALKQGGQIIGYLPNVEQMKTFYLECLNNGFRNMFAMESIKREWIVREKGVRPHSKELVHTAFIVFGTKHQELI